jgi:hypothetical protein
MDEKFMSVASERPLICFRGKEHVKSQYRIVGNSVSYCIRPEVIKRARIRQLNAWLTFFIEAQKKAQKITARNQG